MKRTAFLIYAAFFLCCMNLRAQKPQRPNILVILVDDLGYSDLGCYGSEIATPNIDKLAANGLRFTSFYNTGRCCPTRASLMTGLYPHKAGLGWMTGADQNAPGYKGEINSNCVTMAEVLKPAGYGVYMSGKWHVTMNDGPKNNWPVQRGFERFYGIITSNANYFEPDNLVSGNSFVKPPKEYYITDALSDTASMFISEHIAKKKKDPFFMYLAYNAPHWPMHAKPNDIAKYMDTYKVGWDKIREQRYARQQKIGLFDSSVKLTERDVKVQAWDDVPEKDKALWVKRMAVYAGAVDCVDQGVGRVIETLKKNGVYENTLIVLMSDNGACAEQKSTKDKSIEALGTKDSFEAYQINWANASNTPFRLYKSRNHEGGICAPFIVNWPGKVRNPGTYVNTPSHLIDLMPTFLEVSGANYPTSFNGNEIPPYAGRSMVPLFTGKGTVDYNRPLFWEHEANRAVRQGDWKMVAASTQNLPYTGKWELYNLETDRTETNDLSAKYPDKVRELETMWNTWANANNVFPLDGREIIKRIKEFPRKF